jgi:hypothetical protein
LIIAALKIPGERYCGEREGNWLMSAFPLTGGTNNNVPTATLLAGINPQQLLFGSSGLTNNGALNGILSLLQTSTLTGFSPDTFTFSGNPLFGTGNNLIGTGGTSGITPNPLSAVVIPPGTNVPNPLTGTGGTSSGIPNPLSAVVVPPGTNVPNPLTGTGGTSGVTPNPLSSAVIPPATTTTQNPLINSGLVTNPVTNPAVVPPTTLGSSSLLSNLGLGGTSGTSGGMTQILNMLLQVLTSLGPSLNTAQPPATAGDPALARIEQEIKELRAENEELRQENEDLRDEIDGGGNDDDEPEPAPAPAPGPAPAPQSINDISRFNFNGGINIKVIRDWANAQGIRSGADGTLDRETLTAAIAYVEKRHNALNGTTNPTIYNSATGDYSKPFTGTGLQAFNQEFFNNAADGSDSGYQQLRAALTNALNSLG